MSVIGHYNAWRCKPLVNDRQHNTARQQKFRNSKIGCKYKYRLNLTLHFVGLVSGKAGPVAPRSKAWTLGY
jgi:hypothetical protein